MTKAIEVAVCDTTAYNYPKGEIVELVRQLSDAGLRCWFADQTLNWFPDGLWHEELAPISREWRRNAFWDPVTMAAYTAAKVPGSRYLISHDVIRRGIDVWAQIMITAQEVCGDIQFAIGAGEIKQMAPFNHHEEKPIARVAESTQILKKLWASDEPFSFDGKTLQLTHAHLGMRANDGKLPKLSIVGTGPKLIEAALRYGDGVMVWAPLEILEASIAAMKRQAAEFDRDPAELFFWGGNPSPGMVMTYDTEQERQRMAAAPITKFIAAAWGRMSSAEWAKVGIESPLGPDFHYAKHLIPTEWSEQRVRDIIARVSPAMVEQGILWWTVEDLAQHFAKVKRMGIDMPSHMDWGPFADPTQRWPATARVIRAAQRAAQILETGK